MNAVPMARIEAILVMALALLSWSVGRGLIFDNEN
jgi:hypothetical protein